MTQTQTSAEITIRPFAPADQAAVRALVLEGLGGHFGFIDASLNPDLDDIQETYVARGGCVLVVERSGEIVGCGMLIDEGEEAARLVRMSVRSDQRGQGLGKRLVHLLLDEARARGKRRAVCETTDDWTDAIALYRATGFAEVGRWGGDVHFTRDL